MENGLKILLLEDNPADSKLLEIYLKSAFSGPFQTTLAIKLEDALTKIKASTYDLIISDLSLPDSEGLDTFIKLSKAAADMPIIVLTGSDNEEIGINAMKLGAQDFLNKGQITSGELKRSIYYSLERSKLIHELSLKSSSLQQKSVELEIEKSRLNEAQKLAHIGSWEWDVIESKFTYSDEFLNIMGLENDLVDFRLEDYYRLIHPDERKMIIKTLKNAFHKKETINMHYRIIRPSGEVRMIHARSRFIKDETGKIIKILGTHQDVSDRFREEELEKLALAATQSVNSVIITDKNGKIEWVNNGFTHLTGYELDDVKNTYGEILRKNPHEGRNEIRQVISVVLEEKRSYSYECRNYSKEGREYWAITTVTPILDKKGNVERFIMIDSDITDRKQMEIELQQANNIAEHSLRKGNKALNALIQAKKQLEESLKVKEQFLANMSHEIRTPMNAIIGFTNLVLSSELSDENKQFLNAIKTSGENLMVIINDILDFSKLESGKIVFEKIDFSLNQIVQKLTSLMQPKVREKEIAFKTVVDKDIPDILIGDPTRLNQVLINLIGNAVKFTNVGEVTLEIEIKKQDGIEVTLQFNVKDTGIGIPEESLSKIFESFTQASNDTSRKYGGTGLGLTICKQLVEGLGGNISVSSNLNKGSCFSFDLTFEIGHLPDESNNEIANNYDDDENSLLGVKVLLVEDNFMNQLLAKRMLDMWNCSVEIAENGKIALEKIERSDFDVILMDIQMPEMDGYEATQLIRSELPREKSKTPIIAMTAHAFKGEADKCFALGMTDYISKPFDAGDFKNKLLKATNRGQFVAEGEGMINVVNANGNSDSITDLAYLIEFSNDDNEFVVEMIDVFLEQTPSLLEKIEDSLKSHDWKQLWEAAHKMKPSISFMGIKDLEGTVADIEEMAKEQKSLDAIPGMVKKLCSVCKRSITELQEKRKSYI